MMKFQITTIIIFNLFIAGEIKDMALSSIHDFFGKEITISEHKFSIPKKVKSEIQNTVKQSFFRDKVYYWKINKKNQSFIAIMDNVIGKSMPITFLCIFDSNGNILSSSIIKYREGYGGEVGSEVWLSQFNGMKKDSLYNYPRNISGISGATISVKSVTKGISKLSLLASKIISSHNE